MKNNTKTNWGDVSALTTIVETSHSYNEVLKKMDLKPVTSNTKTLKKYLEKYNISTSHFNFERLKEDSFGVEKGNEPWFKLDAKLNDPSLGIRVELDWNENFINFLKKKGFKGETDDEIIGRWLNGMYKPLSEQMI